MRIIFSAALAAFVPACLTTTAHAQISFGGTPLTVLAPQKLHSPTIIEMPEVDVPVLLAEDEQRAVEGVKKMRFGVSHTAHIDALTAGHWEELPGGGRVWRVGIHCPGATSVSFVFDVYDIPEGGRVFVVDQSGDHIGAFTRESSGGATSMAVMPVEGETIIVEYQVPAGLQAGSLRIGQVTHGYRSLTDPDRAFNASGSCNNNVVCPEGTPWANEIKSVAKIINGGDWCTGQLINNCTSTGTPYFLTANHCVSGENVGSWVFLFNYQSATCSPSANGPTTQTVSGASLLYSNASTDVALLQLNNAPPSSYGVYYTGWDRSGTAPSNSTCIHHPAGDVKKISFDNNAATQATYGGASCWRISTWEDGTTEGGSSGSGLWNQDHRLIGQLYGGQASCSNNVNDYYGRFDLSAPNLTTWLGSCGNTVNGFDPNAPTAALDVQLNSINAFSGSACTSTRTPTVTVRNGGSTTLTSFQLTWSLNGGANTVQNWNGSLSPGATVNVGLPTMNLSASANTLAVSVSAPNGGSDQASGNNSASSTTFYGTTTVTLQLNLDRYGNETTWQIVQGSNVVASGGPYTQQASNGVYPQPPISICLPDGCYDLKVGDSYGDGICCAFGNGNYTLTGPSGTLVSGNGQFTTLATHDFCITSNVKVSLQALLEGPYVSSAGLMHDSLRRKGVIPPVEPYTGLGYVHANGGGGETTTSGVLAVTGNNAIVDWVVLELRSSTSPYIIVATKSALVQRDGDVVGVDGVSPVQFPMGAGSYRVAIRHRNHLGCMTGSAVALSSTTTTVDLRSAATGTYGTEARKTSGSVQLLWAGNAVRDISVTYTGSGNDRDPILVKVGSTTPNSTAAGYHLEDVNMDGLCKYTGSGNDRDPILVNVGSATPTNTRVQQLP